MFVALLLAIPGLYLFFLTQAYYFSTDNFYIVLRAGAPQFIFLPGFGRVVIQTDFKSEDLANDAVRDEIDHGKLTGFWFLHAKAGYELWGEQLANCLEPVTQAKWLRLLGGTKFNIGDFSQSIANSSAVSNTDQLATVNPESFTPEMIQSLTTQLTDKDLKVRSRAASALDGLARTRPEFFTPETIQSLMRLLGYQEYHVRAGATTVLGELAQTKPDFFTPEIAQSLTALLGDQESFVRSNAALALGELARTRPEFFTSDIIPTLTALLTDPGSFVPCSAAFALSQLAQTRPELFTAEIVQSLTARLTNEDLGVRSNVTSALGELARRNPASFTPKTVESLTGLLSNEDPVVRASAGSTLGELAQKNPEITQTLFILLKDGKNSNGRNGASEAVFVATCRDTSQRGFINGELEQLAESPQPYLRAAASQTLEMITIGDLTDEARAHPSQLESIKSRLHSLASLDQSLHEEHLQFAAQITLNELDKIKLENR